MSGDNATVGANAQAASHENPDAAVPASRSILAPPVRRGADGVDAIRQTSTTPTTMKSSVPPPPPPAPPVKDGTLSRPSSAATSPTMSEASDELPNNVSSEAQLKLLPAECLSGDKSRPLRHVDEMERVSFFALRPMTYSVIFILLVELLERFSFYGINYTQTSYLTGAYDEDWSAEMEAVSASTYVSVSVGVAYTTPFVGAFLSDALLGEYWAMLVGALCFYLPGLFLIAFTTIPGLLGHEFNTPALAFGLLFLWPVGTGIVKSIVNVFGAKQFHPLLQSALVEAYYVQFYMCINIGALIGGILVPVVAQSNVTIAYFIPVCILSAGILIFTAGSRRYVRGKPKGNLFSRRPGQETIDLSVILRISLLIVPFNIAYSQMATTFIVQGTVMEKAFGFIDAATMNNADAVSVLFFGYVVGNKLYPWLSNRGIKIPTTYKFAIGSALGVLAIGWALFVEDMIHESYEATGERVNIMWQALSYVLIGAGEIFAVSAAYEVAFTASPPEKKVLASATNLFCVGALPNYICIGLYHACAPWFRNSRGTSHISRLEDYASAHVGNYFWVLFAIAVAGVLINLLPPVREFVESTEEKAADLSKSPKTPSRPTPRARRAAESPRITGDEESPLLRLKRHKAYLKYGSGPTLYKHGSFRAGPAVGRPRAKSPKHVKRSMIGKLYGKSGGAAKKAPAGVNTLMTGAQGMPITAGAFLKPTVQTKAGEGKPLIERSTSLDGLS